MIFSLHKLITRYNPDICVIEAPLLVNSPKTLILLAEIVGAVRGATVGQAKYIEFSPSTWSKIYRIFAFHMEKAHCKSR